MQAKVADIASVTAQKDKVQKLYDELKDKQAKIKKQGEIDFQEMALKQRDKDAEIEVLKEMIKGIKVQVKCNITLPTDIIIIAKDTDI
jgi:endonuclease IV